VRELKDISVVLLICLLCWGGLQVWAAVANTKSTIVGDGDATPQVYTGGNIKGAPLKVQMATVEVASGDSDNSVYRLFRVPSNAVIVDIKIANDAMASSVYNLGIYQTALNGAAVVDADYFGSSLDFSTAHAPTSYNYEATATDISKIEKPLWERYGYTTDPRREFDIALTGTTIGPSTGSLSGILEYTQ